MVRWSRGKHGREYYGHPLDRYDSLQIDIKLSARDSDYFRVERNSGQSDSSAIDNTMAVGTNCRKLTLPSDALLFLPFGTRCFHWRIFSRINSTRSSRLHPHRVLFKRSIRRIVCYTLFSVMRHLFVSYSDKKIIVTRKIQILVVGFHRVPL